MKLEQIAPHDWVRSERTFVLDCAVCGLEPSAKVHMPAYRAKFNDGLMQGIRLIALQRFAMFFALQFVSYGLICWNYRAVARGWVGNVVISDLLFAALSFTLIKKVAEAKDGAAMWGYIAGGACGSAVSVLLTKYLWGS